MKKYLNKNVYESFCDRIKYIFKEFDHIYISLSGGKDSSVTIQLANEVAIKMNKKFDVFFVDLEAQYQLTIHHINELKELSQINDFYHFCLPLENEDNPNSVFRPTWVPWNEEEIDLWVRDMPDNCLNKYNTHADLYQKGDEWEDLLIKFPRYLLKKYKTDKIACLVGIRTDESFHRFRSIAFGKNLYNGKNYSTKIAKGIYNFYPIYDWRTEDIWAAIAKFDLKFNEVYELMYKMGVSIHEQRVCQPFGCDQRAGLNQWAIVEPDTWAKIVNRVSGANFGSLYCKTSLLGHNGTQKPDFMSWEEYAVFLLESLGLYSKELMEHYYRKICILFEYLKNEANINRSDINEDHRSGSDINLSEWISWKRIAKTIEKNDFPCQGLQYGLTLKDRETMQNLKKKWGTMLGLEHYNTKEMKKLANELGYEL